MGGPDARPVVILADDDEAITSNLAPLSKFSDSSVSLPGLGTKNVSTISLMPN